MSRELLLSTEADRRVQALYAMLSPCRLCPRRCGVDRLAGEVGFCGTAGAVVSAATAHFGEEPGISGTGGSGTVFFSGCNLRCIYCQNHQISQGVASSTPWSRSDDTPRLAATMLSLQARGCGNINLVTPSHVVPMAVDALVLAARSGLRIPVVWNSSGYDCVEVLRLLEGVVDVWLPDLRYSDGWAASECSSAPDYVDVAHAALLEMARQVGTEPIMGPEGYLLRGMIIRLLVLPNDMAGVRESLDFILEHIGSDARVALMSQYFPSHLAPGNDLLSRRPTPAEYLRAVNHAERLGFRHALVQEMEAADFYRPDFNLKAEPFADADRFTK
ncbi:MAG TPA: radical SAM protein [Myxococcota bacterium]|nr:radical SAM protein [Myxococcota bacterium]HOH75937.1 radical SAM protein [Myxococcota bacterium]